MSDETIAVWLYSGADTVKALTIAADGSNLPDRLGPWTLVRATELDGDGIDVEEARLFIAAHGYVCFN